MKIFWIFFCFECPFHVFVFFFSSSSSNFNCVFCVFIFCWISWFSFCFFLPNFDFSFYSSIFFFSLLVLFSLCLFFIRFHFIFFHNFFSSSFEIHIQFNLYKNRNYPNKPPSIPPRPVPPNKPPRAAERFLAKHIVVELMLIKSSPKSRCNSGWSAWTELLTNINSVLINGMVVEFKSMATGQSVWKDYFWVFKTSKHKWNQIDSIYSNLLNWIFFRIDFIIDGKSICDNKIKQKKSISLPFVMWQDSLARLCNLYHQIEWNNNLYTLQNRNALKFISKMILARQWCFMAWLISEMNCAAQRFSKQGTQY